MESDFNELIESNIIIILYDELFVGSCHIISSF